MLDLCAAPGGKTAGLAVAMANRGTVVANDVDWRRLIAVGRNLDRIGLVNVATTAWDAANFPEGGGLYDRVLADVPCTCEGTSRKNPGVLAWGGEEERARTAAAQTAILRKAVRLCRPGGRIVYSTCTYAPEENEAVVDAVLREVRAAEGPEALRVADARAEAGAAGFDAAATSWNGERFDRSLAGCLRVWPHLHDTGGSSAPCSSGAELEHGPTAGSADGPALHAFEEVDRERWLAPVIERFGLPGRPSTACGWCATAPRPWPWWRRTWRRRPTRRPVLRPRGPPCRHAGSEADHAGGDGVRRAARRNVLDLSARGDLRRGRGRRPTWRGGTWTSPPKTPRA